MADEQQPMDQTPMMIDSGQQPTAVPSGHYMPTILPSEKSDLFSKINPEETVTMIKYELMGYEYDKNKMEWIYNPDFKGKALTKLGAWQIATVMVAVSSKNVTISKLSDDEIRNRTKAIIRTLMKMCLRNWKEYGIKSRDQIFMIKELALSNSFITLKHPENAGVRQWLGNTSTENRQILEQPKQRGVIDSIFRR